MNAMRRWTVFCGLALLSVFAGVSHAAPENGWWWNPNESGRGFFIEIAGTQVYMAGYFYESDGRATWLVSQGQATTPTSYQGRLLAFAGGQTLFGNYQRNPRHRAANLWHRRGYLSTADGLVVERCGERASIMLTEC